MSWELAIMLLGVAVYLAAFTLYCTKMVRSKAYPNPATWFPWACMVLVNLVTYKAMPGRPVETLSSWSALVTNLGVFALALYKCKFTKMSRLDLILLSIALAAIVVWKSIEHIGFDSALAATAGNLIIQIGITVSIVPTWISAWRKPHDEPILPWFLWGISYFPTLILTTLNWQGWPKVAFPMNAMIIQLVLVVIIGMRTGSPKKPCSR